MAGECPDAIPPRDLGDHSYFGYLAVDRVDEYYQRAIAASAEIVKVLRTSHGVCVSSGFARQTGIA